jgi:hypothetical protein
VVESSAEAVCECDEAIVVRSPLEIAKLENETGHDEVIEESEGDHQNGPKGRNVTRLNLGKKPVTSEQV